MQSEVNSKGIRIPKDICPHKYDINLYLNSKELAYVGEIIIECSVVQQTSKVVLHSLMQYYNIISVELSTLDKITDLWSKFDKCNFKDYSHLISETFIITHKCEFFQYDIFKLRILVKGKPRLKSSTGFYLSFFGIDAQETRNLESEEEVHKYWISNHPKITSNSVFSLTCEPVECRSVFPCFDEPCFKATFNVKIFLDSEFVNSKLKVLTNGNLALIEKVEKSSFLRGPHSADKFLKEIMEMSIDDKIVYTFDSTPKMSIYLLTWIIGPFEYLEAKESDVTIRIFTPVNRQNHGSFALDIATKSLKFYEKYLKIKYDFTSKMDLVAVPAMSYRAMENWGCIVFVNYALLVSLNLELSEKISIARTIAHEISHMWFGNLVTMEWWNDIWLNEGFARLMEFHCLSSIMPKFECWEVFIDKIFTAALEVDSRSSTHPVNCNIEDPRNISNIFDTISYAKGSSILRMFSECIGVEEFVDGISLYLSKHAYKNTTSQDLWNIFNKKYKESEYFMHAWLNLKGHPILTVNIDAIDKTIVLKQFNCFNYKNKSLSVTDQIWPIPLFIKTNNYRTNILFCTDELRIKPEDIHYNNFLKINEDMKGFYKVEYSNDLLLQIFNHIDSLSQFDISGLLFDYFELKNLKGFIKILMCVNLSKSIRTYLPLSIIFKFYKFFNELILSSTSLVNKDNNYLHFFECQFDIAASCRKVIQFVKGSADFDFLSSIQNYLLTRLYPKDDSVYGLEQEKDDEYIDILLKFKYIIDDKQDMNDSYWNKIFEQDLLLKNIVSNFDVDLANKNFKFTLYTIYLKYAYVFHSENKIHENFMSIFNSYVSNYFTLSHTTRYCFHNIFGVIDNLPKNTILWFLKQIYEDMSCRRIYFNNVNLYRFFSLNRKRVIDILLDDIIQSYHKGDKQLSDYLKDGYHKSQFMAIFKSIYSSKLGKYYKDQAYNYLSKALKSDDLLFDITFHNVFLLHTSNYETYISKLLNDLESGMNEFNIK